MVKVYDGGKPKSLVAPSLSAALDRGLATGRLIEEAERLIRTITDHRKKAVRELPIAPLLAAVERAKGLG